LPAAFRGSGRVVDSSIAQEGAQENVDSRPLEAPEGPRVETPAPTLLSDVVPLVEALLFVADEPVSLERLAAVLLVEPAMLDRAITELQANSAARGIRVQRKGQRVQMVTAPEAAPAIERFLGLDLASRLSPAALETLAIVAYRQPVTRADVDAVRGVQSDSVLRSLVNKGLGEEVGRLDQAGRPILYGTTFEFLQHFGLQDLTQLPALEPEERGTPALPGSEVNPT
jgi:segregation and condensation protein B